MPSAASRRSLRIRSASSTAGRRRRPGRRARADPTAARARHGRRPRPRPAHEHLEHPGHVPVVRPAGRLPRHRAGVGDVARGERPGVAEQVEDVAAEAVVVRSQSRVRGRVAAASPAPARTRPRSPIGRISASCSKSVAILLERPLSVRGVVASSRAGSRRRGRRSARSRRWGRSAATSAAGRPRGDPSGAARREAARGPRSAGRPASSSSCMPVSASEAASGRRRCRARPTPRARASCRRLRVDAQPAVHLRPRISIGCGASSRRAASDSLGVDADEDPALAARGHRHVAADEKREPAEHLLLGQPGSLGRPARGCGQRAPRRTP